MEVKIKNASAYGLPNYATIGSAGLDLRANILEPISLNPFERKLIPTGLFLEIPLGYECQIRPRSGLALNYGISVLNAPGTIDSDYRGEVGVILINLSSENYTINPGDRIAQMVFCQFSQAIWKEEELLSDTERGGAGFGSTGKK